MGENVPKHDVMHADLAIQKNVYMTNNAEGNEHIFPLPDQNRYVDKQNMLDLIIAIATHLLYWVITQTFTILRYEAKTIFCNTK